VKTVIITLGSRGSYVATTKSKQLVPGFKVKPVDTTAAGDTFNGALAVALAEGKSMNDAVRFANAAGAISVTRMGAQPSAPKRSEIEKLLGGKKSTSASVTVSRRIPTPHMNGRAPQKKRAAKKA
jgi:ribokinase